MKLTAMMKPLTRAQQEALEMLAESPRQKTNCNGFGRIGGSTAAILRKLGLAYEDNGLVCISDAGIAKLRATWEPTGTPGEEPRG